MPERNKPYTIEQLNKKVAAYRGMQAKRVRSFRKKPHTDAEKKSTKTDSWDMPIVVCTCGTNKPPFIAENGRNCSAIKSPHSILEAAYNNITDNSGKSIGAVKLGDTPSSNIIKTLGYQGLHPNIAGRCAEPHAVNRVLNTADTISKEPHTLEIADLLFSIAMEVRYPIAKAYCPTCKCAFRQLR